MKVGHSAQVHDEKNTNRGPEQSCTQRGEGKAKKQVWSSVKSLIRLKEIMKKHTKRFKSIHERKRGKKGSMNRWMGNGWAMMTAG